MEAARDAFAVIGILFSLYTLALIFAHYVTEWYTRWRMKKHRPINSYIPGKRPGPNSSRVKRG